VIPDDFTLERVPLTRFKVMPRVTITVPGKTSQPYRFKLDRKSVSLGRGSENDIPIDSGSISVKHAVMKRIPGGYELRDLGSTNGIKSNEGQHMVIPLVSGEPVKLGDVDFDFNLTDEELAILATEKPGESSSIGSPIVKELPEEIVDLDPEEEDQKEKKKDRKKEQEKDQKKQDAEDDDDDAPRKPLLGGCAMLVLFLILAAAAFVAGMAIRCKKDTGHTLTEAIKLKLSPIVIPAGK
jgi:pSer/pThr/pTyr-binding forkhead associated (FHA) protein